MWALLGVKRSGVRLTTLLHLVPRLRMRGAISPLPNTSVWRGASLRTRDYFIFTLLPLRPSILFASVNWSFAISLCVVYTTVKWTHNGDVVSTRLPARCMSGTTERILIKLWTRGGTLTVVRRICVLFLSALHTPYFTWSSNQILYVSRSKNGSSYKKLA
jgi:hypothetical protein